jgi:predicted ATPase/DNA-binding CsgD family transcriptional regulator/Tfp pilus assembly protein PilF
MGAENLPSQPTPFIGRVTELEAITHRLADPACRLLTLVGPGGIGKTRLAIEAERMMTNDVGAIRESPLPTVFPDGVVFVPLQPVASADLIVPAIAESIGFQFSGPLSPKQQLGDYLRDKSFLLILDNVEHLLEGIALISDLLADAPNVRFLATSRETLNLREEWLYPVQGMNYPTAEDGDSLSDYDAVQFFVQNARRVQPGFSLETEWQWVIRLCQQVEGMPLALELAAAWLKRLPCKEIVAEIERGLDVLESPARNVEARHRSMRAVLEHSWSLLSEKEQAVFRKLAAFQGGFTREAAEQVTAATLSILSALVDKSWLRVESSGRYSLHELVRQYAAERLADSGEVNATRDAHCGYYAGFLHHQEAVVNGPQSKLALNAIEVEIANIRVAWNWAVDHDNIEAIEQSRSPLADFYEILGWWQEGQRVFHSAVAALRSNLSEPRRTILLGYLLMESAVFDFNLAKFESAKSCLHESLRIFQQNGDKPSMVKALKALVMANYLEGDFKQSYLHAQDCLALAQQIGDDRLIEESLYSFGFPMGVGVLGTYRENRQLDEQIYEAYKRRGELTKLPLALASVGSDMLIVGEYEDAQHKLEESLAVANDLHDRTGITHAHELLGQVAHAHGDFEAAEHHFQTGLEIAREIPSSRNAGWCLLHSGHLARARGEYETAKKRFQETFELAAAEGEKWKQARAIAGLGRVAYHQGNLAEAEEQLNEALSRTRDNGIRLDEAQIMNILGRVAIAGGNLVDARKIFAEALQIGLEIDLPPTILETLIGVAELKTHEGDVGDASELCNLCLQHPALHADAEAQARTLLVKIQAEFPSTQEASNFKPAHSSDLAALASDILMELTLEQSQASSPTHESLTERELEVLRLLATRRTNQEIAGALFISVGTVKTHVHRICSKLHVTSRREVAVRAAELHLL